MVGLSCGTGAVVVVDVVGEAGALVVAQVPLLRGPVDDLLDHARQGSLALVLVITVVNGVAEEVFFRGALYAAVPERWAVALTTVVYTLAFSNTGNDGALGAVTRRPAEGRIDGSAIARRRPPDQRSIGAFEFPLTPMIGATIAWAIYGRRNSRSTPRDPRICGRGRTSGSRRALATRRHVGGRHRLRSGEGGAWPQARFAL